ncbi:MAG: hypothetical protein ABDH59_05370 [Fervidobacterium sp.]
MRKAEKKINLINMKVTTSNVTPLLLLKIGLPLTVSEIEGKTKKTNPYKIEKTGRKLTFEQFLDELVNEGKLTKIGDKYCIKS